MNEEQIHMILANDQWLFRSAVKACILHYNPLIKVLSEPEDFIQLFQHIADFPDAELLISDDVMPQGTIIEALQIIRLQVPRLKIIVSTMHADVDYIKRLIPFCDGVLSYINISETIDHAIKTVLNEGIYVQYPGVKKSLDEKKGRTENKN